MHSSCRLGAEHSASRRRRVLVSLVAGVVLTACGDVRSLSPAIEAKDAVEEPELVGRWRAQDSSAWVLDVERSAGTSPAYRMRLSWDRVAAESIAATLRREGDSTATVDEVSAADTSSGWLRARVGRIGARLVVEGTPEPSDSLLDLVTSRYAPLVITAYQLRVLELSGRELRLRDLRADSALARVRGGRCETPYARDTTRTLTLTGSSAQVRRAYACLLQARHALDSATVFTRLRPAGPPPSGTGSNRPPG